MSSDLEKGLAYLEGLIGLTKIHFDLSGDPLSSEPQWSEGISVIGWRTFCGEPPGLDTTAFVLADDIEGILDESSTVKIVRILDLSQNPTVITGFADSIEPRVFMISYSNRKSWSDVQPLEAAVWEATQEVAL